MDVKAQIFSIIAILMSFLFILIFSGAMHIPLDKDVAIMTSTVDNTDLLIDQLEYIVDSAAKQSTYEILNGFSHYSAGVTPINDPGVSFIECFMTGSSSIPCFYPVGGVNFSIVSLLNKRFEDAKKIYNVDITYSVVDSSFDQVSHYSVQTNITLFVSVQKQNYFWNRTVFSSQEVSLLGITDPLSLNNNANGYNFERVFSVRPSGNSPGTTITVSQFKNNYSDMLLDYVKNGYYFMDSSGPSFLQMLQLDLPNDIFESNKYGISSFVPPKNEAGDSMYIQNLPTTVYQYVQPLKFTLDPADLRRINPPLDTNSIYMYDYLVHVMGGNADPGNGALLRVETCCDPSGCDPSCGDY